MSETYFHAYIVILALADLSVVRSPNGPVSWRVFRGVPERSGQLSTCSGHGAAADVVLVSESMIRLKASAAVDIDNPAVLAQENGKVWPPSRLSFRLLAVLHLQVWYRRHAAARNPPERHGLSQIVRWVVYWLRANAARL